MADWNQAGIGLEENRLWLAPFSIMADCADRRQYPTYDFQPEGSRSRPLSLGRYLLLDFFETLMGFSESFVGVLLIRLQPLSHG